MKQPACRFQADAGHNFPGGTIDLIESWVDFTVRDASQRVIFSSGHLLPDDSIDPEATVYKEVAVDRHGQKVWRHDLFNMVGKSYVNVIPAGASDILSFSFKVPDWAKSPLHLSATLKYRKFNLAYFSWVNRKNAFLKNPVIDIARDKLSLPLEAVTGVR